MPKFFIEANQMQENKITLLGEDVNHIANVLRKKVGDEINICNISTSENFLCQIEEINKDFITCKKQKALQTNTESNTEVTIFQEIFPLPVKAADRHGRQVQAVWGKGR